MTGVRLHRVPGARRARRTEATVWRLADADLLIAGPAGRWTLLAETVPMRVWLADQQLDERHFRRLRDATEAVISIAASCPLPASEKVPGPRARLRRRSDGRYVTSDGFYEAHAIDDGWQLWMICAGGRVQMARRATIPMCEREIHIDRAEADGR